MISNWLHISSIWCSVVMLMVVSGSPSSSKTDQNDPGLHIDISAKVYAFNPGEIAFYQEAEIPANSTSRVTIDFRNDSRQQADNSVAYGILQVHACMYNISLSYNATLEPAYQQTGTDLGLIVPDSDQPSTIYIHNKVYHSEVNASIAFIPYNRYVPVPGGCSMERRMKEVPILGINIGPDITTVDTPLASSSNGACNVTETLAYTGYHLYLKRSDFSCRTYFDGIHSMMTTEQLRKNGQLGLPLPTKPNRRTYLTLPGTGVVFATLVTDVQRKDASDMAAYVPAFSVACSPLFWETNCDAFNNSKFHVFIMVLIGVGIIRAYLGRLLVFIGMAIDGFIIGVFAAFYMENKIWPDFVVTEEQETAILLSSGAFLALLLTLISFCNPSGKFVVHGLTNIIVGYILATFTSAFMGGNFEITSSTWWQEFIFLLCAILVFLILPPWTSWGCIILSASWGTVAIVSALSMYFGSNLPYILINTFTSVRLNEFRYANRSIAFEWRDIVWLLLWIGLFVSAVWTQIRCLRSRESFSGDERTPLVTRWTCGSDDVFESPNTNSRFFARLRRGRGRRTRNRP